MEKHEELEGKEVLYKYNEESFIGIVVGCEWPIGVTITEKDNPEILLVCLVGPSAPNYTAGSEKRTHQIFNQLIEMIKDGIIDEAEITSRWGLNSNKVSTEHCPFSQ